MEDKMTLEAYKNLGVAVIEQTKRDLAEIPKLKCLEKTKEKKIQKIFDFLESPMFHSIVGTLDFEEQELIDYILD